MIQAVPYQSNKIWYFKFTTNNETFEILEILGRGSFGTVYKIKNVETKEYFVIKIFNLTNYKGKLNDFETEEEVKKDFDNEIRGHKLILESNMTGEERSYFTLYKYYGHYAQTNYFLIMDEYNSLPKYYNLTCDDSLQYFHQILNRLMILRKYNLFHGDLKYDNTFLTKDGKNIILGDLGTLNIINTKPEKFIQTVCISAPEVFLKTDNIDNIDIIGAADILLRMLTGNSFSLWHFICTNFKLDTDKVSVFTKEISTKYQHNYYKQFYILYVLSDKKKENTEILAHFLTNSKYGSDFILKEPLEPKVKGYTSLATETNLRSVFRNMFFLRLNHRITDNKIDRILSIVHDCIEFSYRVRATPEEILDKYLDIF